MIITLNSNRLNAPNDPDWQNGSTTRKKFQKHKHVEAKQYATKKNNGSLNTKEEILENLETNDNENITM